MPDTNSDQQQPDLKPAIEKLQAQIDKLESRVKELEFQNTELNNAVTNLKGRLDSIGRPPGTIA
jgi:peptidoglycan hydrolase CwlO-like protein